MMPIQTVIQAAKRSSPLSGIDDPFRNIFDAVNDGIFISDPTTNKFIEVNKPGCAMFGYTRNEIIGGDVSLLSSNIPPYTREGALKQGRDVNTSVAQTFEWQCKTKDDVLFWTEVSLTKTRIGDVAINVGIMRDITERKKLNEELKCALEDASAASDSKSSFLATMSHELHTPLNAIIGFSDLMAAQFLGPLGHPRYGEYIDDIHTSGQHLLALIDDVLDLSRLDAGKSELFDEDVSLHRVTCEACRMIETHARKSNIEIMRALPGNLPHVRGDERRIKQIVLNLLSNAVKFTPEGGSISITAEASDAGLMFRVRDTGIGIAQADLPRVLERFGQVDNRLSRKYAGTGLGLPLAKQLIELHGGSLCVESEAGLGTTIIVAFPPERIVTAKVVPLRGRSRAGARMWGPHQS